MFVSANIIDLGGRRFPPKRYGLDTNLTWYYQDNKRLSGDRRSAIRRVPRIIIISLFALRNAFRLTEDAICYIYVG